MSAKGIVGYCELKEHELLFSEGWSKLLDQGKQAKQFLADPSEMNEDNLNNVIHEASRHLGKNKRE
jgi:hypothetical protein